MTVLTTLIVDKDVQSIAHTQRLPPLDLNTMQWTVEIQRLQTAETNLSKKVDQLKNKLECSSNENAKLSDQVKSLEITKENLEKNVVQLEDKVQGWKEKLPTSGVKVRSCRKIIMRCN